MDIDWVRPNDKFAGWTWLLSSQLCALYMRGCGIGLNITYKQMTWFSGFFPSIFGDDKWQWDGELTFLITYQRSTLILFAHRYIFMMMVFDAVRQRTCEYIHPISQQSTIITLAMNFYNDERCERTCRWNRNINQMRHNIHVDKLWMLFRERATKNWEEQDHKSFCQAAIDMVSPLIQCSRWISTNNV